MSNTINPYVNRVATDYVALADSMKDLLEHVEDIDQAERAYTVLVAWLSILLDRCEGGLEHIRTLQGAMLAPIMVSVSANAGLQ